MGLILGHTLAMNRPLHTNDYIQSPSQSFFLVMQADGNLVVYRGSGPQDQHGAVWGHDQTRGVGQYFAVVQGDANLVVYEGTGPSDNHGVVWASNATHDADGTSFFGAMQDDGNFVVYHGKGPGDQQEAIWADGVLDPVVSFADVQRLEYDVAHAKIEDTHLVVVHTETVQNGFDVPQSSDVHGSQTVTTASSWSDSTHSSFSVQGDFQAGVPLIAEGKIDVSFTVDWSSTRGGSTKSEQTIDWNQTMEVPAHSSGEVSVVVSVSTLSIPYSLVGTRVYQSGTRVAGRVHGIYTGTTAYDVKVQLKQTATSQTPIVLRGSQHLVRPPRLLAVG